MEKQTMSPPAVTVKPEPEKLDFFSALKLVVKEGKVISKLEWNNSDYGIMVGGKLRIYRDGKMYDWILNDGDILGEDWIVLEETN